jgi:signal transduction histidine kinase
VKGHDELAALGRTFNHMAESLQSAEEGRKAMTADIAHELRTPLAVQRAHLEAIEDKVYPLTMHTLSTIDEQNELLTRLVDDLSTLALVDAGELRLQTSLVEFPELIKRAVNSFSQQADERRIEVSLSLTACPPLNIDAQRIQQILHNLMSNALRFTPEGGRIQFLLNIVKHESGDINIGTQQNQPLDSLEWAVLQVMDNGPGIPSEALPHIFDRFFRADKSRSRSGGGTGLGLSIARKIAQAHGGELTADNRVEGGAVFKLILPV